MATVINWKDAIDKPYWRQLQTLTPAVHAAGNCMAYDLRNHDDYKNEIIWQMSALTYFNKYFRPSNEWWLSNTFTTVGGAIGAGSYCIFVPSGGITGTVAGSPTTTSFTLATLPNSGTMQKNQMANYGGRKGMIIRVIDVGAGKTGKICEREIIANTSGTAPVIRLDSALDFTPTAGTTTYEILTGSIFVIGSGSTAAGFWKKFDVATETISGNLNVTNLPATIGTDTIAIALDEQYVPYDRNPGEGFLGTTTYDANGQWPKKCLTATGSAAATITGQASGGDASVLANEYRNFQIRIVEDATTPAAVGQRRIITSHTAGASPVYTVAAWTTQPSSSAKFVIELNNDILLWTGTNTVTYSYRAGFQADANWSTAAAAGGAIQYANPGLANGAGAVIGGAWSMQPDIDKNARHSHIFKFRGAASTSLEELDIAGGANGVWTTIAIGQGTQTTLTTGWCGVHDPIGNSGRYIYMNAGTATPLQQRTYRFDMMTRTLKGWAMIPQVPTSTTAAVGQRMSWGMYSDDTTGMKNASVNRIGIIYLQHNASQTFFDSIVVR